MLATYGTMLMGAVQTAVDHESREIVLVAAWVMLAILGIVLTGARLATASRVALPESVISELVRQRSSQLESAILTLVIVLYFWIVGLADIYGVTTLSTKRHGLAPAASLLVLLAVFMLLEHFLFRRRLASGAFGYNTYEARELILFILIQRRDAEPPSRLGLRTAVQEQRDDLLAPGTVT